MSQYSLLVEVLQIREPMFAFEFVTPLFEFT